MRTAVTSTTWRCRVQRAKRFLQMIKALWAVFSAWKIKADDLRREERLEVCRGRLIYDERRRACGILGEEVDGEPLGRRCFMPLKAKLPEATSWLTDRNQGGWPDYLNGVENFAHK